MSVMKEKNGKKLKKMKQKETEQRQKMMFFV